MLDRSTPPVILPIDDISLQKPQVFHFSNGIPFYVIQNPQLDLIHFILQIKTGTLYEQQKHISSFTYSLLKESSTQYSANEIADLMDFNGTYYSVSQYLDKVHISFSIPKDKLQDILPIISDFVLHPNFKEDNLDTYKRIRIKDLAYNEQKTEFRATRLMLHAMFGDQYTVGQFSTQENISAITTTQMAQFHDKTFVAENITFFATGNMDMEVTDFVERLFDQIPHGEPALEIPEFEMPHDTAPLIHESFPKAVQASLCLAMPSIGYLHPDKRDFSILSTITGGYFGSRLMQRLREKEGFTYGISCGSVFFGNQSLFVIDSNVNKQDTDAALAACFEEMQLLQTNPISSEELQNAQNYIIGEMLRNIENSVSYLKTFAGWHFRGLDEHNFTTQLMHIRQITPDRILELAKNYLTSNKFTQIIVN